MPRLGNDDSPLEGSQRREATAYADSQRVSAGKVVLFLSVMFVLRNMLLKDYRTDAVSYLKNSGQMSDDEIEKYIPKTYKERKEMEKTKINRTEHLLEDVETLKKEVMELKMKVFGKEDILPKEEQTKVKE